MEDSIISYCQHRLGLANWSDLKSFENMPQFLDLILSEELMSVFPPEQYQFAANLINGRKKYLEDYENTIRYLRNIQKAFARQAELPK